MTEQRITAITIYLGDDKDKKELKGNCGYSLPYGVADNTPAFARFWNDETTYVLPIAAITEIALTTAPGQLFAVALPSTSIPMTITNERKRR